MIKHTLKYLYEAEMTAKISTKTGKNFRGGWGFFWLARIYTPVESCGALYVPKILEIYLSDCRRGPSCMCDGRRDGKDELNMGRK